jgi:hypothetical protein
MSNDKVQDLIEQVKNLQLQQTELLVRLERARGNEARAGVYDEEESGTREFAIGDKVRIKNPTRFQADQGVITKIGPSPIIIHTKTGSKILRAPKKLIPERWVATRTTQPAPRHRITEQTATPQEEAGEHAEAEEVVAANA